MFGLVPKAIRIILQCVVFLVRLLSLPQYFLFLTFQLKLREGLI